MSDDIEERMRTLAVRSFNEFATRELAAAQAHADEQDARFNTGLFCPTAAEVEAQRRAFVLYKARIAAEERLHKAALVVGKHFHDETDASWSDVHEYEAAALEFYKAVRAEQEGT